MSKFDFLSKFSYETPYSAVEAKHIPINDSACINKAIEAISYRKLISKYMNDAASVLALMHFCVSQDTCLWRRKSTNYVCFPYSRYYESKYKYEAAATLVNMYIEKYNTSINDLKVIMSRTNPSEAIGYSIVRSICAQQKVVLSVPIFNTAEPRWTTVLLAYRFVVDKKIKKIILCIDTKTDKIISDFIESVQNDTYEKYEKFVTTDLKEDILL